MKYLTFLALLLGLYLASLLHGVVAEKRSKGCNKNLPKNSVIGDYRKISLNVNDPYYNGGEKIKRRFQIRLPKGYDNTEALPLIYKAHGMGGKSEVLKKDSDFAKIARDREDFILVLPDGMSQNWNTTWIEGAFGPTCDLPKKERNDCPKTCPECKRTKEECYGGLGPCVDDLGFIELIQKEVRKSYCIDENQMHFHGYSMGGALAWEIASATTDGLGFATFYTQSSVPALGFGLPPKEINFSLFDVIGNQDTSMPPTHDVKGTGMGPHNSIITKFDGLKPVKEELLQMWAEAMDCGDEEIYPTSLDGNKGFECHSRDCSNEQSIVRCTGDFGHWPPNQKPTADIVLDFMLSHPRKQ